MKMSGAYLALCLVLSGFSNHAEANLCPDDSLERAKQRYDTYLNRNEAGQAKLKYQEGKELMSEVFGYDLNPDAFLLEVGPAIVEEYLLARQLLRDLRDRGWFKETYDSSRLASIIETHINSERGDSAIEVKVRYLPGPEGSWRLNFEVYYTRPARWLRLFSTRTDEELLLRIWERSRCLNYCEGPIVIETLGQSLMYSRDGAEKEIIGSLFSSDNPPWFQQPAALERQQKRIDRGYMDFETYINHQYSEFMVQCIMAQHQEVAGTSE